MERRSLEFSSGARTSGSRNSVATLSDTLAAARQVCESAHIRMADDIAIGANTVLGDAIESTLVAALRESIANIIRHSMSTRVIVRAWRTADYPAVVLDVMDDGRGCGGVEHGAGLRAMRERVEVAGGRMAIGFASGDRGTRITIMLPLEVERAPEAVVRPPRRSRDSREFEAVGV